MTYNNDQKFEMLLNAPAASYFTRDITAFRQTENERRRIRLSNAVAGGQQPQYHLESR
jgi:hypothetical protein